MTVKVDCSLVRKSYVTIDAISAKYFGIFYAENLLGVTQTRVISIPAVFIPCVM